MVGMTSSGSLVAVLVCAATRAVHGSGLTNDPIAAASVQYLNGSWAASLVKGSQTVLHLASPAVPGDLITDLELAGHIGDPLYELNFKNASLWDTPANDTFWKYTTTFPSSELAAAGGEDVWLVFDGVKMGATVKLNGNTLGVVTDQFLRYNFSIGSHLVQVGADGQASNSLEVIFDGTATGGRYMACTGGWDWGPYSNTYEGPDHTFSKGIWKSVYLARTPSNAASIIHVVPHVFYRGGHATSPLEDKSHAGFNVSVTTVLRAGSQGAQGVLNVQGEWAPGSAKATKSVKLSANEEREVTLQLPAEASDIQLWWPAGMSNSRTLYDVAVSFQAGSAAVGDGDEEEDKDDFASASAPVATTTTTTTTVSATRKIGFRVVALVTGNDTDPAYVKRAASLEGSDDHGLYFRVNGAAILARGGNVIPMDNMEGRYSAEAHRQMVAAAAAGRMNFLRVWGGGIYLPDAFYDEADARGVLVYHDLMYTTTSQTHIPFGTEVERAEITHNLRRLSHHPSIFVWNACNECGGKGLYTSFAMTQVAAVDKSRPIWPSCPSSGWGTGVRMLDALPNGNALSLRPNKSGVERHGPYANGNGWQAVNQAPFIPLGGAPYVRPTDLPVNLTQAPHSLSLPNQFTSEFGASVFSSFESMAPTLASNHWSVHGGAPEDNCSTGDVTNSFWKDCTEGHNPMAERNYPCDNLILGYFGAGKMGQGGLDDVGEAAFQRQLWQCMIAQALSMQSNIETRRSINTFGIVTWQLNEIWPTGGWGSLEYGTVGFTKGQVVGGRWRPLHHFMRQHLFTDVFATCGTNGVCFVKNDAPRAAFAGTVTVEAVRLKDGVTKSVVKHQTKLSAGPGQTDWFDAGSEWNALASSNDYVFTCNVTETSTGGSVSSHVILANTPEHLHVAKADVKATINTKSATSTSVDIEISATAPALYVTLTTQAQGRFSENAILVSNPTAAADGTQHTRTVQFLAVGDLDLDVLKSTLRVEHLGMYVDTE